MQKDLLENLPKSFISLRNSHKPHLVLLSGLSLFLTFVIQFHKKAGMWFHKMSGGVVYVPSKRFIFSGVIEAAPAFVCCSELGGSDFRGTDLLALVGTKSVPFCLSIVERLSLFQLVCLGRFHCRWFK